MFGDICTDLEALGDFGVHFYRMASLAAPELTSMFLTGAWLVWLINKQEPGIFFFIAGGVLLFLSCMFPLWSHLALWLLLNGAYVTLLFAMR